jgi:hypothetical protein
MSMAAGLIVAIAIVTFGGIGLAWFAIAHRQRDDDK